jgi:AraC-like DNA-binding protein/mannose-6-phosphate isomerase-like protein (cupin superfamily)
MRKIDKTRRRIMDDGKTKRIALGDINPFIRISRIHTLEKSFKTGLRLNIHYQLHYILNGTGYFHIDGIDYVANKGELCLWGPGQIHSISSSDESPLEVIGVQFDFTRNFSHDFYVPIYYNIDDFKFSNINEIIEFTNFRGFPPYVRLKNKILAENMLRSAVDLYNSNQKFSQEKASLKLKEFFIHVADESEEHIPSKQNSETKASILEYINNHCFEDLSNHEIADAFKYHPIHINRIILETTGFSLHQYILKLRINEAVHLLTNSRLSIREISEKIGFSNPQYFSRIFKSKTGVFPTYLRK